MNCFRKMNYVLHKKSKLGQCLNCPSLQKYWVWPIFKDLPQCNFLQFMRFLLSKRMFWNSFWNGKPSVILSPEKQISKEISNLLSAPNLSCAGTGRTTSLHWLVQGCASSGTTRDKRNQFLLPYVAWQQPKWRYSDLHYQKRWHRPEHPSSTHTGHTITQEEN